MTKEELSLTIITLVNQIHLKQMGNVYFHNMTEKKLSNRFNIEQLQELHEKILEHKRLYFDNTKTITFETIKTNLDEQKSYAEPINKRPSGQKNYLLSQNSSTLNQRNNNVATILNKETNLTPKDDTRLQKHDHEEQIKSLILDILDLSKKKNPVDEIPGYEDIDLTSLTYDSPQNLKKGDLERIKNYLKSLDVDKVQKEINLILHLAKSMQVDKFPDMDIDFNEITIDELRDSFTSEDRQFIIESLEKIEIASLNEDDKNPNIINPLSIVNKYMNGAIRNEMEVSQKTDHSWRKQIHPLLKSTIKDWRTISLESFYVKSRDFMNEYKGNQKSELRNYVSELSRLVFIQEER